MSDTIYEKTADKILAGEFHDPNNPESVEAFKTLKNRYAELLVGNELLTKVLMEMMADKYEKEANDLLKKAAVLRRDLKKY